MSVFIDGMAVTLTVEFYDPVYGHQRKELSEAIQDIYRRLQEISNQTVYLLTVRPDITNDLTIFKDNINKELYDLNQRVEELVYFDTKESNEENLCNGYQRDLACA